MPASWTKMTRASMPPVTITWMRSPLTYILDFSKNTPLLASTTRTFTSRAKALLVYVKGDNAVDVNTARLLVLH